MVPLPSILGGFETLQKHFFEIFGAIEQKEKVGEISKKIGKTKFRWRYLIDLYR